MRSLVYALCALPLFMTLLVTPAAAGEDQYKIGSFVAVGDEPNIQWTRGPTYKSGGTFSSIGESKVLFTFASGDEDYAEVVMPGFQGLDALGPVEATMVVTSTLMNMHEGGFGYETHSTFSFIYAGADPLTYNGQTFGAGAMLYKMGPSLMWSGQGGGLSSITHYSDLVDLSVMARGWGHSAVYLDVAPPLVPHGRETVIDSYQGRFGSGVFYGSVPEPATWALIVTGFGFVGAAIRRTRERIATA